MPVENTYIHSLSVEVKKKLKEYLAVNGIAVTPSGHYSCFIKTNHKHGDRTPSAYMDIEEGTGIGLWRCAKCDAGGTIYDAAAVIENANITGKGFIETTISLASRLGIPYDEAAIGNYGEISKAAVVEGSFQEMYLLIEKHIRESGTAIDALTSGRFGRNYPLQVAEDVSKIIPLGVVDSYKILAELREKFPDTYRTLPFLIKREDGNEYLDSLVFGKNSLTYPLRRPNGTVYGFMARIANDFRSEKKAAGISIPSYKITNGCANIKSSSLLLLDIAMPYIKTTHTVFIVEGLFDALLMHLCGFRNTVALMGTSVSPEMVESLERLHVHSVNFILDSDDAGYSAVRKAIKAWSGHKTVINVIPLPGHDDPDVLLSEGEVDWIEKIESAISFVIKNDPALNNENTPNQIRVKNMIEFVAETAQLAIEYREYAEIIAEHMGRGVEDILFDIRETTKQGRTSLTETKLIMDSLEAARLSGPEEFHSELLRAKDRTKSLISSDGGAVTGYTWATFQRLISNPDSLLPTVVKTGFPRFDEKVKLTTKSLVVWSGCESNGKSTILRNMCVRGFIECNKDAHVFYVSADDDTIAAMTNAISVIAGVDSDTVERNLRAKTLFEDPRIARVQENITNIFRNHLTIMGIEDVPNMSALKKNAIKIRDMKPDATFIIVLDAVQDLKDVLDSRDQRLSIESLYGDAIELARSLDATFHAVNHQKAETTNRITHRPTTEGMKGSSYIKYATRNTLLAHMPLRYDKETSLAWSLPGRSERLPIIDIELAKDKQREAGGIYLPFAFNPYTGRVEELSDIDYDTYITTVNRSVNAAIHGNSTGGREL